MLTDEPVLLGLEISKAPCALLQVGVHVEVRFREPCVDRDDQETRNHFKTLDRLKTWRQVGDVDVLSQLPRAVLHKRVNTHERLRAA